MKTTKSIEFIRNKINSIEPQMRYDGKEDFKEWQKKARAKLEELLGLPFEKCDDEFKIISEEQCDGYKSIEFEFQSEEGYYIPCTLLVPDEIKGILLVSIFRLELLNLKVMKGLYQAEILHFRL